MGLMIFTLAIWLFFQYYDPITEQKNTILDELSVDVKSISNMLLTPGYPPNWTNATVQMLGFTNAEGEFDSLKLSYFLNMSYEDQKKHMNTRHNFLVYFLNENNSILQIDGHCGIGDPQVINDTYVIALSYVYREASGNELRDEMLEIANESNITVDIFRLSNGQVDENLYDYLTYNHSNYVLAVLDDIEMTNSSTEYNQELLETLTREQNTMLFVIGDLTGSNPQNRLILGVNFTDNSGCGSYPNITITNPDPLLTFNYGDILEPQECHYVNSTIVTPIGQLYQKNPGAGLKDAAIGKWEYGNGTVYYFSHFKAEYLGEADEYQNKIKQAINQYVKDCFVVLDLDQGDAKNRVVLTRLAKYNNQLIKMVMYLWEEN